MTCKDCYHYEACKDMYEINFELDSFDKSIEMQNYDNMLDYCKLFKAKDKVIELPCKVGDTVYKIGSIYRNGKEKFYIYQGKFGYSCIRRFGKTVFLTKEEAEKALKELKE